MKISSPRHLRRRQNLGVLVAEAGGPTQFAAEVSTPKSHISALLSGARGVGDSLASKFERKMDKPAGWMDEAHEVLWQDPERCWLNQRGYVSKDPGDESASDGERVEFLAREQGPAYGPTTTPPLVNAIQELGKALDAIPERSRRVVLMQLDGLVSRPQDAPEVAREVEVFIASAKQRAA